MIAVACFSSVLVLLLATLLLLEFLLAVVPAVAGIPAGAT
jgi:hypothetical protein